MSLGISPFGNTKDYGARASRWPYIEGRALGRCIKVFDNSDLKRVFMRTGFLPETSASIIKSRSRNLSSIDLHPDENSFI